MIFRHSFYSLIFLSILVISPPLHAEDGYRLWLRYDRINDASKLKQYTSLVKHIICEEKTPGLLVAEKELNTAVQGLLGTIAFPTKIIAHGTIVIGTHRSPLISGLNFQERLKGLGPEGYLIASTLVNGKRCTVITANEDTGVLYGVFHFIRLMQTHQNVKDISIRSTPRVNYRLLNHWDNLDRTVERGYAGFSLWDWHKLPDHIDQRYYEYARANASIGINGTVLTNVNANAQVITEHYLKKVAALADVFRPYGIKVYLTARFSAPVEIGGLKTADPLDPKVKAWWKNKVDEIYSFIPDFGGFVVKANSEGQPGPQNYNRNHADGANMLAEAVAPHNGIVMWRAFVYSHEVAEDRVKQAYNEFTPLDGKFHENVLIQVKNGPLDFQPREPFHPLFGAMPKTPLMMEFQITQEYLGFATHLVYLAPLFKECLDADTHVKGTGSTVGRIVDGTLEQHKLSGMAGVANIGNDRNWCGHPFAQANWYAFGRLAWNHTLGADTIAEEWLRMTFTNNSSAVDSLISMMIASREIVVQYMTPLGLHHIMGYNHHYGPGPWIRDKPRADWTSVYYHLADDNGIGFDRTASGSNALEQYAAPVQSRYSSLRTCPEEFLLWFHHASWDHRMQSGRTLWEELCHAYYKGADSVQWMQKVWRNMEGKVNKEQFEEVNSLLKIQHQEAVWWRNACVLYFQRFSKKPVPQELEKPSGTLEYYEGLEFPFAPGIRPKW